MSIVIHPNLPLLAAQGVTAPVVLQPGTVISARVQQVLGNDTVRISIGGQSLDVQSQVPLQAGQTLQLAVSQATDGGIALAVVSQQGGVPTSQGATQNTGPSNAATIPDTVTLAAAAVASIAPQTTPAVAAPTVQLTPQEALAVSVAAQSAATLQTSLAPLFANLGVAAGLNNLPPQLQQAIAQVLSQQLNLDQNLTGSDIQQAFQSSGLFLEASLASGSLSQSAATPDLKAALIVLRQVLSTSLDAVPATQGALATQSVLASAGVSLAGAAVQQGATPTAVVAGAIAADLAAQEIVTAGGAPAAPAAAGAAPQAVISTAATAVLEADVQSLQLLAQPVTITAEAATLATVSPTPVPQPASETAAAAVLTQGATAPDAPNVLTSGLVNPLIPPASALTDAALRAAASSAALNLLQEAVQSLPLTLVSASGLMLENGQMLSLIPAVAGRQSEVDDAEMARSHPPPPPLSGALPTAQPVMPATLVSNSPAESAMHRLLADTDAAIARQTLLQVASLPGQTDTTAARLDPTAARWNFEIPFATPQGTAMAQFEISRDGGGNEVAGAKRVWRARFSLDVEPAGPVHALVSFSGARTSVRMWAERPQTAAQLRARAGQLSQALALAELQPGDIVIADGTPPQAAPAKAGHFLDRAL
jgi:Flagellar hook-length control protein FliK